jgi:hypothetical protein
MSCVQNYQNLKFSVFAFYYFEWGLTDTKEDITVYNYIKKKCAGFVFIYILKITNPAHII